MASAPADPLWYKDAIIYELHVKAFYDSSGDGRGDFRGLIQKLDYIQDLGVNAIWLLPFYPSPLRDDGYDIADYRGVHPDYGSLRDFKLFVREAHRRGLRVITELVINHTSDRHPWFQAARRARPGSSKRNYYVWSDTDTRYASTRIIFTDTETSNWTWDPVAEAYYWHRFFHHQPDLNFDNPQVARAVIRVLRYWLDMGVDGLRLDAVPYLVEREGTNCENLPETHAIIKQLRSAVDQHYEDRMLLAEANQWPDDVRPYFGDGDECHMAFHFPLMPRIFMAVRQEDRRPITEILARTPAIPDNCQWALFLRNHDELTLEMVTDEERDYMYKEYAKDARMRVNVGIRRRLAPLLDNGRRRIELLNSLLFSFPGTPVIYYGDEIGMGDNIYLGDRDGVRTPMQWTADRNAGFSSADPARLYLPPIMDPVYGYPGLNVEAQERNPSSLLHFMKRLIALRRQHKAFGRGTLEFLHPRNRKVVAYLRRYRGEVILAVANLSRFAQPVELDLREFDGWTPLEMIGHTEFPPIGELPYFLTLGPHAFYWFRLEPQAEPIRVQTRRAEEGLPAPPWLSLESGYDELFGADYRFTVANDAIGPFMRRQRWFQGKAREVASLHVTDWAKFGAGFYLVLAEVEYADGGRETYSVPLKAVRGEPASRVLHEAPATVLARLKTAEGEGVLYDALADRLSCATFLSFMVDGRVQRTEQRGRMRGFATGGGIAGGSQAPLGRSVRRLSAEQSNTSVILDDAHILKFFRRIQPGPNPDMEIGRFLTERTDFRRIASVEGGIEYVREGAETTSIAMAQVFVPNQGDGWDAMLAMLRGFLERCAGRRPAGDELPAAGRSPVALASASAPASIAEIAGDSLEAARVLGRRTGELHLALASDSRDRSFSPMPIGRAYLRGLADEFSSKALEAVALLESRAKQLPAGAAAAAHQVLSSGTALVGRFESLGRLEVEATRIRVHGDYHLGQTLRVGDDFVLLDFEGEPLRPLAERLAKASPLKDVAGMLRSFGYAARAAFMEATSVNPERVRLREPWLRAWETWVSAAFLGAYLEASAGASFLPADTAGLEILLDAFTLDKAFYELRYELNNRPDWVAIPLEGILSILGRMTTENG